MSDTRSIYVSVLVPVYNEQDNVGRVAEEVGAALRPLGRPFELLFVDDVSSDGTAAAIRALQKDHPFVQYHILAQHGGQSAAMLDGLRHVRGDVVVTMDGDCQNDPADIPALLKLLDHADVACGFRGRRRDTFARRIGSRMANRVRNWVTHDGVIDTGCSLKAFKRELAGDLPPLRGVHRFMPAWFRMHGRTIEQISVNHRARERGQSKYTNLKRLPETILDLFGFWWFRRRHIRLPRPSP